MSGKTFGRFRNVRLIGATAFSFLNPNLSTGALPAQGPGLRSTPERYRGAHFYFIFGLHVTLKAGGSVVQSVCAMELIVVGKTQDSELTVRQPIQLVDGKIAHLGGNKCVQLNG